MPQFMLLLHEPPSDNSNVSPEEIQKIIGEYSDWRSRLEAEGRMVAGHKLKDEGGRDLSAQGDSGAVRVVDGPYAEAKEVVGGFFILRADDYDEAVEISKSCPHLTYGSHIELRQVDLVD